MSVKAPAEKNFRRPQGKPAKRKGGRARISWRALRLIACSAVVLYAGYRAFDLVVSAATLQIRRIAVRGNVRLTKGFFEDTLPGFVAQHPGAKIALLHIDCDLYSSTVTILKNVADMLVPGTIIIFDELINYHGWEEGEYKAFTEFAAERKLVFEYVAYNRTGGQVAIRILDKPPNTLS